MLRIAVTGLKGQLAESLAERAQAAGTIAVVRLGRPALDLAHPADFARTIGAAKPDVVVNAAAYTAVDRAESEPEATFAINRDGAGAVATAAAALGLPLIHVSTDYVFDGSKETPYREDDTPAPTGVYGASKLAGEQAVRQAQPRHIIMRTAWVYSPFGHNFLKTMLRLAAERDEIRVVDDQLGNPTSALDLADSVLAAAHLMVVRDDMAGTFHVAGRGEASWAQFAAHIMETSRRMGGPSARITAITTRDYPTPTRRPQNSRLDCSKFEQIIGKPLPDWQSSSAACIARLL